MQFKIFKSQNIIQGVSETNFGSMLGKKRDKNAKIFLNSLNYKVGKENFVWAEQIFGSKVHICKEEDSGKIIRNVDGLLSNIPGQILVIVSADCLPILIFDPKNKVIANLHGSRNSLIKGIVRQAISKMVSKFNSQPKNLLVAIGPHIRSCHYWLKEKTYQKLKKTKYKKYFVNTIVIKKPWHNYYNREVYFDLTKLVFDQLLQMGIKRKNIEDCKICTFCQFKKYFSARKKEENPKIYPEKKPRFASFIGLEFPQILEFSPKNLNFLIQETLRSIKKGKVIVCPTDTVYGLVADATNKKAVEKIFKIKKRKFDKPIPIFVKDIKMAREIASINKEQEKFLKKVWPGKVTFVLKRARLRPKAEGGQREIFGIDKKTIGLRIPDYKFLYILLKKLNRPLTGTSANISGEPASTKIKEVINQFKNQKHQPDLIINAGNLPKSKPSRVIDLTSFPPKILRP